MSTPDQIVDQVRIATDYQINKHALKEKIQADLHFTYNNGLFKASSELFSFVTAWTNEDLILLDVYENPIKIQRTEFLEICKQHYQIAMNAWYIEHEKLKKIRKI